MTWTVKVDDKAAKVLKSLDKPQKQGLEAFIDGLQTTSNPRARGKALQANLPDIGDTVLVITG